MADPVTPAAGRRFRPEIEGLRAIAAALVVIFHVFVGRVSGGVDVFFVVAGFLITGILLGQAAGGRLRPGRYFSRLAARLLPLSLLVLIVTSVAILLLAPLWYQPVWLRQAGWSALYLENWALAGEAVQYLGKSAAASPVQQFWALSIQGQFYVIWILLFALVMLLARGRGPVVLRRTITIAMSVLLVGSFAYAITSVGHELPGAYFLTGARVWEFAAGGLIALAVARGLSIPTPLAVIGGWLGLALLLTCGIVVGNPGGFPGWAALWPVAGAVLILCAGDARATSRLNVARLLGSRPLVWAGGFSYALYLWHWPILALYRARTPVQATPLVPGLLIIATAVILAILTTRFVDSIVRARIERTWTARRTLIAAGIGMLTMAVIGFGIGALRAQTLTRTVGEPRSAYLSNLASAREDFPLPYLDGCVQGIAETNFLECTYEDPQGTRTVMLIGGSHAAHWFPAVQELALRHHWKLVTALKDACRFTLDPKESAIGGPSCDEWNDAVRKEIASAPPDLVITNSTVSDGGGEHTPDGYVEEWKALGHRGVPVLGIRDTPRWMQDPIDCLNVESEIAHCWVPRSQTLAKMDPAAARADVPDNVTLVDLNDDICEGERCPAARGDVVVYWDLSHLTATFARSLADRLDAAVPDSLRG